jgi:hypothetical protein
MSINNAGTPAETTPQPDARESLPTTMAARYLAEGSFAQPQLIDYRNINTILEPVPMVKAPRAVSQSVAAGLIVPQGTKVNLVVAPRSIITANVFVDAHPSFQEMNLDKIDTEILSIPAVKTAALQSTPLTEAQKNEVKTALAGKGIVVNDAIPANTLERALGTLRNAVLFTNE